MGLVDIGEKRQRQPQERHTTENNQAHDDHQSSHMSLDCELGERQVITSSLAGSSSGIVGEGTTM